MSRLSIIITVDTATSRRQRPSLSMSATCESLKTSRAPISSYSLSKVPPVTSRRMATSTSTLPILRQGRDALPAVDGQTRAILPRARRRKRPSGARFQKERRIPQTSGFAGGLMGTTRRVIALVAASAVIGTFSRAAQEATPGRPATVHLKAYIEAFNSGSPETMRAFFQAHYAESALRETPVEERVTRFPAVKSRLQSIRLEKVAAEQPSQTFALARAGNGEAFLLRASVETTPPFKLLFI